MPRAGQILPLYTHPHTEVYINDNTEFVTEVYAPSDETVRMLYVISSSKGRDNVVLPMSNLTEYFEEFGQPNYRLYGQPGLMPYASLKTSLAKCWVMRVMPENATHANVVILAKAKVDKTIPASPKLIVKHVALCQPSLSSQDEFDALIQTMTVETPDTDGFVTYPVFGVMSLGRGAYGNSFRIRMSPSAQTDVETGFKNYKIELLDASAGLARKEMFVGSLDEDALVGNTSYFLADRITDSSVGSKKFDMQVHRTGLEKLYELYKTALPVDVLPVPFEQFDILYGLDMKGVAIPHISIDVTGVALDGAEGLTMSEGDEGDFGKTGIERETAIDAAYIKAFNGELDRAILSKRRVPAEAILDAGYSDEVKRALANLLIKRYDAFGMLDGGILQSINDALTWSEDVKGLSDRVFTKDCQHYKIRDPFTAKTIPVTVSYFFASQIPLHFAEYGNHIPFAGLDTTQLTGYLPNTLKPVIDADDLELKEQLHLNKVNYFECIAENKFCRGTQVTAQLINSDLSEQNNMMVLLQLKRLIEEYSASKSYNFAEPRDRQTFTEGADRLLEEYKGLKVRDVKVRFQMNAWEEERSILHCYLDVTFKTMSKSSIIEIDINKRTASAVSK